MALLCVKLTLDRFCLTQAGLEGDVIKLTADVLTTGPDGLIRARLPFNNIQGASSSLPGLTLAMTPIAAPTAVRKPAEKEEDLSSN